MPAALTKRCRALLIGELCGPSMYDMHALPALSLLDFATRERRPSYEE